MKKALKKKIGFGLFFILLLLIFAELCFFPLRKPALFGGKTIDFKSYFESFDNLDVLVPEDLDIFRVYPVRIDGVSPYSYTAANMVGFFDVSGKSPIVPFKSFEAGRPFDKYDSIYYDLFNVKYFIVSSDSLEAFKKQKFKNIKPAGETGNLGIPPYVKRKQSPASLFENTDRLGPLWVVDNIVFVNDDRSVMNKLNGLDVWSTAIVNPANVSKVFLDKMAGFGHDVALNYNFILNAYDPDYISVSITTNKSSFVVFSEPFYPGWHAYVDGEETDIIESDYFLRGVLLDRAGDHVVELKYQPLSFYFGAAFTGLGIIIFIVAFLIFLFGKRGLIKRHY